MTPLLLSIFPLPDEDSFARVTITEIEESLVPPVMPFVSSRDSISSMLMRTSLRKDCLELLRQLDEGLTVQVPITEKDGLLLLRHDPFREH